MSVTTITARELYDLQQQGKPIDLLDVRTPAEHREVHAVGAHVVPLDRLDATAYLVARGTTNGEPVYLICKSGSRARQAGEKFAAAGFAHAVVVEGGTQAWEQAGLPVRRGKKTIALDRQVRIAAGFLVFVGTLLGALVSEWFLVIPGFVGCGLMFAGITDTCGMAMMLGRMPWNQVKDEACEAPASQSACCSH